MKIIFSGADKLTKYEGVVGMDNKISLSRTHQDASQTLRELSELVSKLQQREFELEKEIQGLKRQIELIKLIYSPEIKN